MNRNERSSRFSWLINSFARIVISTFFLFSFQEVQNICNAQPIDTVRVVLEPSPLRQDLINVNKRAPIPFKAFQQVHPKTGKAIPPDSMLTLFNGKRMVAKDYFRELNRIEQELNKLGYSLRDTAKEIVLQNTKINKVVLNTQAKNVKKEHKQRVTGSIPKSLLITPQNKGEIESDYNKTAINDKIRIKAVNNALANSLRGKTASKVQTWNWSAGDNDILSAYLRGRLEVLGVIAPKVINPSTGVKVKDYTKTTAEVNGGGYIFGKQAELLNGTAVLYSPKDEEMNLKVDLNVLGNHILTVDENSTVNENLPIPVYKFNSVFKGVDISKKIPVFSLGPFSINAKVGARGSAGFTYLVCLRPLAVSARLSPYIKTSVYAEASVDAYIAEAGVGCNLTLLNDHLGLLGEASLNIENPENIYVDLKYSAYNELSMLAGKFYIFVEVGYPCISHWLPDWCTDRWTWTIWDWDGIVCKGYLFNESEKIYL